MNSFLNRLTQTYRNHFIYQQMKLNVLFWFLCQTGEVIKDSPKGSSAVQLLLSIISLNYQSQYPPNLHGKIFF